MFDISFMELLVISMVALIVIGPERLPAVARTIGHLYGRCRSFVYSIRTDIHNEMRMEELKKMHHSMQDTIHTIEDSVQQHADQLKTTIDDGVSKQQSSVDQVSQDTDAGAPRPRTDDTSARPINSVENNKNH
ncbi:MAG: Sec-independent protein translocase protein TatB [Nitrosomonas sp.]|uniref:Sec-independent protein translocase protein TatB n=1 Tax=Nitrosomonas sp. TaxID=42353 RepID=UPI001D49F5B5|nr:Sec-independent protein translocase protein TatB [Nitrosomonas sp.]MBX9894256.1 Sec-independent protein translocase protein TatB [Nitrosomonas sp.]